MDPMYKTLENSLKNIYGYSDVYVKEEMQTGWYVPYFGPQTRSEEDVKQFIEFSEKVIKKYPRSQLFKKENNSFARFGDNEQITHPAHLVIWQEDVNEINNRSQQISEIHEGINKLHAAFNFLDNYYLTK